MRINVSDFVTNKDKTISGQVMEILGNRAVIIGEKSYGKGTVQEIIDLVDGSKLEITIGKYRTPNGRVIDQVGISPDLLIPDEEGISKALLVLSGLSAISSDKK